MFKTNQLPADSCKLTSREQSPTIIQRFVKSSLVRQFAVTFVVACAATGISLSLFIVVLDSLYRQYGGRTLI